MATIRKSGLDPHQPIRDRIGEDRSFGRASLLQARPLSSGLNPLNALVEREEIVMDKDASVTAPVFVAVGYTRH